MTANEFVAIYQANAKNLFSHYSTIDEYIRSYSVGRLEIGGAFFHISASNVISKYYDDAPITISFDSEHLHVDVVLKRIVPPKQLLIIPEHLHSVPYTYKPLVNITTISVGGRDWQVIPVGHQMIIKTDEESAEHDLMILSMCRTDVI